MDRLISMCPTCATPRAGKANHWQSRVAITIAIKAPGRDLKRPHNASRTSEPMPMQSVGMFHCGAWCKTSYSRTKILEDEAEMPVIVGNCLITITSARPKVKPRSTGLAMKSVMAPSRAMPAATK